MDTLQNQYYKKLSEEIVLNADTFRNLHCIDIMIEITEIITVNFSKKYIHFPVFNKK